MDLRLIYAIVLTILPISELRGGLPLAIVYAAQNNIPLILIFPLIVMLNVLIIFFVFYFLDNIHHILLLNVRFYKRIFESYMNKFQKRIGKFEKRYSLFGFLALTLFVAVPLPVTGAWSGCLLSWVLDLDRKKSILCISLGVMLSGILVLLGTLGFLNLFS